MSMDSVNPRNDNRRSPKATPDVADRIHWGLLIVLQMIMVAELTMLLSERQWLNAVLVMTIMAFALAPALLGPRLPVKIPPEFQVLAIAFVFAALFLGEVRRYYELVWWWDIALHASSGLMLGIVGFLLVYVLNENEKADIRMRPKFVAVFAFAFSLAVGALWEIFEFAMDQTFGTQMQKPRFGDPSGLTDTMADLIVDSIGALLISAFGWWYMVRDRRFVEAWVRRFLAEKSA